MEQADFAVFVTAFVNGGCLGKSGVFRPNRAVLPRMWMVWI